MPPAGDQQGLEPHPAQHASRRLLQLARVGADARVKRLLQFRLIRRGRGGSGVLQEVEARINRHQTTVEGSTQRTGQFRRGGAVAVVGNQSGVGPARQAQGTPLDLRPPGWGGRLLGLAVNSHYLLAAAVDRAR